MDDSRFLRFDSDMNINGTSYDDGCYGKATNQTTDGVTNPLSDQFSARGGRSFLRVKFIDRLQIEQCFQRGHNRDRDRCEINLKRSQHTKVRKDNPFLFFRGVSVSVSSICSRRLSRFRGRITK